MTKRPEMAKKRKKLVRWAVDVSRVHDDFIDRGALPDTRRTDGHDSDARRSCVMIWCPFVIFFIIFYFLFTKPSRENGYVHE